MKKTILALALAGTAPASADVGTMTIKRYDPDGKVTVFKTTAKREPAKAVKPSPKPTPKAKPKTRSGEDHLEAWFSPGCRFWWQYVSAERAKEMLACRP